MTAFGVGDVIVATPTTLRHYTTAGTLVQTLTPDLGALGGQIANMNWDGQQHLYLAADFSGIVRYNVDAEQEAQWESHTFWDVLGIASDCLGENLYTGLFDFDGEFGPGLYELHHYLPDGTWVEHIPLTFAPTNSNGLAALALRDDDCTLFISDNTSDPIGSNPDTPVYQWDICTGGQLADFALLPYMTSTPGIVRAMVPLADGGIGAERQGEIARIGAGGGEIWRVKPYAASSSSWRGLGLDADGEHLWAATTRSGGLSTLLGRFALSDGTLDLELDLGVGITPTAVTVVPSAGCEEPEVRRPFLYGAIVG